MSALLGKVGKNEYSIYTELRSITEKTLSTEALEFRTSRVPPNSDCSFIVSQGLLFDRRSIKQRNQILPVGLGKERGGGGGGEDRQTDTGDRDREMGEGRKRGREMEREKESKREKKREMGEGRKTGRESEKESKG